LAAKAYDSKQRLRVISESSTGDFASMRFFFAFFGDFERNRDISTVTPEKARDRDPNRCV
jgi:hypothetical protein